MIKSNHNITNTVCTASVCSHAFYSLMLSRQILTHVRQLQVGLRHASGYDVPDDASVASHEQHGDYGRHKTPSP